MKRRAILGVLCAAAILSSQTSREEYRTSYAEWRQADPNLERDAADISPAFSARVTRVAETAAKYGPAHANFLRRSSQDGARAFESFAAPFNPALDPLANSDFKGFTASETRSVETNLRAFAADRSAGIQRVRSALDRERAALVALNAAIDQRIIATTRADLAIQSADKARTATISEYSQISRVLQDAAEIADKETVAWADYYAKLVPAPAAGASTMSNAKGVPPVPLLRYVGNWSFPATNGEYSGLKPEFVDFAVHENNGLIDGSFYGRFTIPPGFRLDPVLRFDFKGPLTSSRTQRFDIETADGAKGTIDLIPGSAINLLEINFSSGPAANKIQQGNMVLLKR